MKKVLLLAVMAVAMGFAAKAYGAPAQLTDVPPGHWAYDAVKKLVDIGCVEGYPDGTFKGDRPMTRYEYAMVVSRCMDVIDKKYCTVEKCQPGTTPPPGGGNVDWDEVKATINKLASEFKDELAALKVQVEEQGKRISALEDKAGQPMIGKLSVKGSIRQRVDLPHTDLSQTNFTNNFYNLHYLAALGAANNLKAGYEIVPSLTFDGAVKPNANVSIKLSKHIANQSVTSDMGSAAMGLGNATEFDIDHAFVSLDFKENVKELDTLKLTSGYQNIVLGPIGLLLDNSGVVSNPAVLLQLGKGPVTLAAAGGLGNVTGANPGGIGAQGYDALLASRLGIDLNRVKLGFNWMGSGFQQEKGWSGDVEAKLLLDSPFLPALRGEYLTITNNYTGAAWPNVIAGTAAKDYSYVLNVDVYKTKRAGLTIGYADTPAVPTMTGLDLNPFSEFDTLCSIGMDYPNYTTFAAGNRPCISNAFESGRVLFPGGFKGIGVEASYKVLGDVTLGGKAVMGDYAGGAAAGAIRTYRGTKYPGYGALSVSKPINSDTTFTVEYMQQGKNPILLNRVRGELLINF